jgi:predicted alpha-1,2-mannosidase
MKKLSLTLFFCSFSIFAQNLQQYVNPMIGTGGTGHTFPGATLPYGMVQLSPDTRIDGSWEGCSGYHYSDNRIYGFSHTHLSGTGVSDYGDILIMPTMGKPSFDNKIYSSTFSHQHEKASSGFYQVKLDKHHIDARLTASTRVGFHEYTFNQVGQANIILDLNHRDELLDGEVRIIDQKRIWVKRVSKAWAENQHVYALIEFDKAMEISDFKSNGETGRKYTGTELALSFSKKVKKGEKLKIKVSLSFTGFEGAEKNSQEIPHWDFEKVKKDAEQAWNKALSKIEVKSKDQEKLTIFYSALYHVMIHPNIAQDVDGKYRGMDMKIHQAEGFDYYTVFSLWDTFRALHPLLTIIDKKRTIDFLKTFEKMYEQGGKLPVWELASNETNCMIGYHSVSVIADAMMKGIKGPNYELLFEAAKHSAMQNDRGLEAYKKHGFISIDDYQESVSKTTEYAYDDWCIAQMALALHKKEDYQYFMKRSQSWKNLFNPNNTFIQPKLNGGWDKFDAKEVNNNYTEANGWQYTFFVPHDLETLIEWMGGSEKFEQKLDEMFSTQNTSGRQQVDITGLIGQYAHGNEPSHHFAYLYNFIGKREKTKEKIHYILNKFYKNDPDGLIGNEDCGQMSAWYVLSAMGIYNICPGQPNWTTTEPFFDEIKVNFEDGQSKTITKQSLESELFSFGINPLPKKGALQNMQMVSELITPVPVIRSDSKTFANDMTITIENPQGNKNLGHTIVSRVYNAQDEPKDFTINNQIKLSSSSIVEAAIKDIETNQILSQITRSQFFKKPNNFGITLFSKYNPQYHAGGPDGLIDGVYGSTNWRKGDWQGYQSQNFEAIIDLKSEKEITEIYANFLQDTRSWILMPTKVEFYSSLDGVNFNLIESVLHQVLPKDYESQTLLIKTKPIQTKAKFIKIIAHNFGKLPDWHQGFPFNGEAFIFVDEVGVK